MQYINGSTNMLIVIYNNMYVCAITHYQWLSNVVLIHMHSIECFVHIWKPLFYMVVICIPACLTNVLLPNSLISVHHFLFAIMIDNAFDMLVCLKCHVLIHVDESI